MYQGALLVLESGVVLVEQPQRRESPRRHRTVPAGSANDATGPATESSAAGTQNADASGSPSSSTESSAEPIKGVAIPPTPVEEPSPAEEPVPTNGAESESNGADDGDDGDQHYEHYLREREAMRKASLNGTGGTDPAGQRPQRGGGAAALAGTVAERLKYRPGRCGPWGDVRRGDVRRGDVRRNRERAGSDSRPELGGVRPRTPREQSLTRAVREQRRLLVEQPPARARRASCEYASRRCPRWSKSAGSTSPDSKPRATRRSSPEGCAYTEGSPARMGSEACPDRSERQPAIARRSRT